MKLKKSIEVDLGTLDDMMRIKYKDHGINLRTLDDSKSVQSSSS